MTDLTKKYRKLYRIFAILYILFMIGTTLTYVINAVVLISNKPKGDLSNKIGATVISMGVTIGIFVLMMIFIGSKFQGTIWMLNLIAGSYLFGVLGMWITFSIWVIDEYVMSKLAGYFKNKYTINREIDKRL